MNLIIKQKLLTALFVIVGLSQAQLSANYCAKCQKIETERMKEQTDPTYQKPGYYDDFQKQNMNSPKNVESKTENDNSIKNSIGTERNFSDSEKDNERLAQLDLNVSAKNSSQAPINNRIEVEVDQEKDNSIIADILSMQNLTEVFEQPFTILAPSDESIKHFPDVRFKILDPHNRELLLSYVSNHIIPHQILKQDFDKTFKTLGGRIIEINDDDEKGLTINKEAKILKSLPLGNHGIIYVIDRVLIPIHD